MYRQQKEKLTEMLNLIKECLIDDNFTIEEKQQILGMLACL